MKFTQQDLLQCTNLITALKGAKFDLSGTEVLALAEVLKWTGYLHKNIKESLEQKPAPTVVPPAAIEPPAAVAPIKSTKKRTK